MCVSLCAWYMGVCVCMSHSVLSNSFVTPWTVALQPLCAWDSPGKNTGVGCHALLQRILLTQGSSPHLLHCGRILYH